jgi:uncharacterized protein YjbJ (UPF0337 family)
VEPMSKFRNKTREINGIFRERLGKLTGNKDLERRGRLQRSRSQLKQAGENVRDAATG